MIFNTNLKSVKGAFAESSKTSGFSILELMISIVVLSIIVSIAYPSYAKYIEDMDVTVAITDIITIEQKISAYEIGHGQQPANLAAIGMQNFEDPWGNPYQYLSFDAGANLGSKRKDHALVPVNSDYDLYSMGKDGRTASPFTSALSYDDVVRANNGSYRGLAEDF